jgi:hypothetical protein
MMSQTVQQDVTILPAMVMMTIGRWNQILEILGTRPWTEVNPLIVDIHRQIGDAVQAQTQSPNEATNDFIPATVVRQE